MENEETAKMLVFPVKCAADINTFAVATGETSRVFVSRSLACRSGCLGEIGVSAGVN